MRGQVLRWGNSLAVRIPKAIAEEARLQPGDTLEIAVADEGSVQVSRVGKTPTLAQLVSQITPENRYEAVVMREVGKEHVEW